MTFASSLRKISDLFPDVKIGGTPSRGNPSYFGGRNLWVSIRDMQGQSLITSTSEMLSDEGVKNSNCKLVKKGSLLFSFKLTVGRVAFAGDDLYTNEAIAAFDIDDAESSGIDLRYLSLVLPIAAIADSTRNSMGAALLSKDRILELKIPLPEKLEYQQQIADRLTAQLAEVGAAQRAALAQVKEALVLRTRIIEAAYSCVGNFRPIGSVAKLQSGYAFKSQNFKRSGVRLLRNANILPGEVYWDDSVFLSEEDARNFPAYELREGDVLISLDRPLISSGLKVARVKQADLPALLLQRVGRFLIDADSLNADYLYRYLQSQMFIGQISGHEQSLGVPHISPDQVEAVELPLPSVEVQRQFIRKLQTQISEADAITQAANAQLAEIESLPQRIIADTLAH